MPKAEVRATAEIAQALAQYIDLRQRKQLIEKQMMEPRAIIEEYLGDNERLLSEDGSKSIATWSWGKDKTITDWPQVIETLRKKYDIPPAEVDAAIALNTRMEKGARTFRA